jgi:hypothetical protein
VNLQFSLVTRTKRPYTFSFPFKCLIIGFILCRNNDINKDDDYEVEDKNNYNDKNKILRLMLFFKQQATDFMFAPCINSIKHCLLFQLMHTIIKL